jgi:4-amino-4-deoxy-L-arabinose transferase-like glycosyltransferase
MTPISSRLWLMLIVATGIGLRAFRLDWADQWTYADGLRYFVRPAADVAALGKLVPEHYIHPTVLVYALTALYWVWSLLSGVPIHARGRLFYEQLPTLTLLGRGLSVAISGMSIVVVYLIGRRLIGRRGALLAAAVLAVSPLHVLESHRINPDTPAVFIMLLATLVAVVSYQRRSLVGVLGAFAISGIAAATKYTGGFAATVPAWLIVRWPEARPWPQRLLLLSAGALLTGLGFIGGCLPCVLKWEKFLTSLRALGFWTYVHGMPGVDVAAEGWQYTRYLYSFVVGLPYLMGWPAYLAGLVGLAVLMARNHMAANVLMAAIVPFFLFMGGAITIVARYYLPLSPYLALAAGAALDRFWNGPRGYRRLGIALTVVAIGYTVGLTSSQCLRLGIDPQHKVAELVAATAKARTDRGRPLVVAYPSQLVLSYDAVNPLLRAIPDITILPYPPQYKNVRLEQEEVTPEVERLAGERRWITEHSIDVVILPSWVENSVLRERPHGTIARFYAHLASGQLGFRLGSHFRTHYWTERLYTWGDPMLDTHWETAIVGYKVFVRDTTAPEEPA